MAKKKIQVQAEENPYGPSDDVCFSLCSSPATGRKQILGWQSCKAYIHDAATAEATGDKDWGGNYTKGHDPPIDMEKLRLLIGTANIEDKEFKERLYGGKKILNLIEKAAGWDKSKIAPVEIVVASYECDVYLITGPKQWMASPHMISMVTMIIRQACRSDPGIAKDEKSATKLFEQWSNSHHEDAEYFFAAWDKIFFIAKNFDKIFGGIKLATRYVPGGVGSHGNGIASLCSGTGGSMKIVNRLKKLCEENNVRYCEDDYDY